MKFDPSKLVAITPNRRKSEPFDMRYSKSKKFKFSSEFWAAMDLDFNGVSMFKYPGGGVVISVQPEETSQVLKMRKGYDTKGKEFTSNELANLLSLTDKQADFQLNLLSDADGVSYLMVAPFTEKQFTTAVAEPVEKEAKATKKTRKIEAIAEVEDVEEETEDGEEEEELDSLAFDEDEESEEEEEEEDEEEEAENPLKFLEA